MQRCMCVYTYLPPLSTFPLSPNQDCLEWNISHLWFVLAIILWGFSSASCSTDFWMYTLEHFVTKVIYITLRELSLNIPSYLNDSCLAGTCSPGSMQPGCYHLSAFCLHNMVFTSKIKNCQSYPAKPWGPGCDDNMWCGLCVCVFSIGSRK